MIRLAQVIESFEADFLRVYGRTLLPSQRNALRALKACRNDFSARMQTQCTACAATAYVPHSCGHRSCPHCQAHESQQWIERQQAKQLPCDYFMLTFTVPAELRPLVFQHPTVIYDLLSRCAWDTVNTFSHTDKRLQGTAGAMTVLHTHTRPLDFHPHVHLVMPAGAIHPTQRVWRTKNTKYLFNEKALAKVFRAKLLAGMARAGLTLPPRYPEQWVAHCKRVGSGAKAIAYLGRYLYRGVIQEKDILVCDNGQVTYRYFHSKKKRWEKRTVTGVEFLRLVLQHVLPKGFRRARNFGFLHANSKRLIALLHLTLRVIFTPAAIRKRPVLRCACCGGEMTIVRARLKPHEYFQRPGITPVAASQELAM